MKMLANHYHISHFVNSNKNIFFYSEGGTNYLQSHEASDSKELKKEVIVHGCEPCIDKANYSEDVASIALS